MMSQVTHAFVDMSIEYAKCQKISLFSFFSFQIWTFLKCEAASVDERKTETLLSVPRGPNSPCQMVKYKS